jgi:SSS family solute:Na+ symporter
MALYFVGMMIFLNFVAFKVGKKTAEDYHMASREFKMIVLFFTVFGTNISAVALVGAPGSSYHVGWVTWAYYVSAWAWLSPLLFYAIGNRAWTLGKKHGYMTQADVISGRWKSHFLSYLVGIICLVYTVPYVMVGAMGGGQIFAGLTNGGIPYWLGALLIMLMVTAYVVIGGMRGTAWTNVVETTIFLSGAVIILIFIAWKLGGPGTATSMVAEKFPHLLTREKFPILTFFSFGFIVSLAVPMFPQVFIRLLVGESRKEFRKMCLIYPLAGFIIWFVVCYTGMWGHLLIPSLAGKDAEQIMPMVLARYAPFWGAGLLGATMLAGAMSCMDAQILTVSTLVYKDFLSHSKKGQALTELTRVRFSQFMIVAVCVIAYILALTRPVAILLLVNWSFAGFAALLIPMLAALYWKRCTKEAAIASILVSQAILIGVPLKLLPASLTFGMLPGFSAMVFGAITLFVVTYLTRPQEKSVIESFFGEFVKVKNPGA